MTEKSKIAISILLSLLFTFLLIAFRVIPSTVEVTLNKEYLEGFTAGMTVTLLVAAILMLHRIERKLSLIIEGKKDEQEKRD